MWPISWAKGPRIHHWGMPERKSGTRGSYPGWVKWETQSSNLLKRISTPKVSTTISICKINYKFLRPTHQDIKTPPQRPRVLGSECGSPASSHLISFLSQVIVWPPRCLGWAERRDQDHQSLLRSVSWQFGDSQPKPQPFLVILLQSHSTAPMQQKSHREWRPRPREQRG